MILLDVAVRQWRTFPPPSQSSHRLVLPPFDAQAPSTTYIKELPLETVISNRHRRPTANYERIESSEHEFLVKNISRSVGQSVSRSFGDIWFFTFFNQYSLLLPQIYIFSFLEILGIAWGGFSQIQSPPCSSRITNVERSRRIRWAEPNGWGETVVCVGMQYLCTWVDS